MRYWAWLAAKLVLAAAPLYGLLSLIAAMFPPPPKDMPEFGLVANGSETLLLNLILMGWFLLCCGTLYGIIWDQRHRCRTCLRRLRMPVATGSWSRMLQFGRPQIEYMCPYGHGTLTEDELQISGRETPHWDRTGDLWQDLCAASKEAERHP
jgi:hypothetical protein